MLVPIVVVQTTLHVWLMLTDDYKIQIKKFEIRLYVAHLTLSDTLNALNILILLLL